MRLRTDTQFEFGVNVSIPDTPNNKIILSFTKSISAVGMTIAETKELIDLLQKNLIIAEQNDNPKNT